jgi:glycosyltransferase involved in cell wall biosynthesis
MTVRVLIVSAGYFPEQGGVETHVHEVASRLFARDIEVEILTTDLTGRLPRTDRVDSIPVRRVAAYPANRDWRFAPGLLRAIRRGPWDIVHCQGYHTFVAPLALAAAWRAGIPSILTFHSGGPTSQLRGSTRTMQMVAIRPLVRRARALVAVSEFERRSLAAAMHLSPRRFAVIPNGSSLPRPRTSGHRRNGDVQLVSVGRLVRYKGHHRVLAAMPDLLTNRPESHLQIIGSGPQEPELRRMVSDLGLDSHVTIRSIPGADRQAMADVLGQADLVTFLSEYESQGIAALEAITLGRNVLVADTSALSDLATQGLAHAVALHATPADTAQAILAALDAPAPRADRARWTWDDCADRLAVLYQRVAAGS